MQQTMHKVTSVRLSAAEAGGEAGAPDRTQALRGDGSDGVTRFAAAVVARLVARDATDDLVPREALVEKLMSAVALGDASALEVMKPELKRARVSAAMLADVYIPEVARRLGEGWMQDCVTFAEVTMGTARLQAILREIGSNWSADAMGSADGPIILIVLPVAEQHTLGAMVLAGKLRRRGISVAMRIAPHATDLAAYVGSRSFDAAFVSVAVQDRLETCGKIVRTLKDATGGKLKVAVGGALLEQVADFGGFGADMISSDIDAVLAAFGVLNQSARVLETI